MLFGVRIVRQEGERETSVFASFCCSVHCSFDCKHWGWHVVGRLVVTDDCGPFKLFLCVSAPGTFGIMRIRSIGCYFPFFVCHLVPPVWHAVSIRTG